MVDDPTYSELLNRLSALKERQSQAAGALAEIKRQMRDEFGISTLKEARAKLAEMERDEKKARERHDAEVERLRKELDDAENAMSAGGPEGGDVRHRIRRDRRRRR
jgi:hypothetical protein